jgi:hypothetical protein
MLFIVFHRYVCFVPSVHIICLIPINSLFREFVKFVVEYMSHRKYTILIKNTNKKVLQESG